MVPLGSRSVPARLKVGQRRADGGGDKGWGGGASKARRGVRDTDSEGERAARLASCLLLTLAGWLAAAHLPCACSGLPSDPRFAFTPLCTYLKLERDRCWQNYLVFISEH